MGEHKPHPLLNLQCCVILAQHCISHSHIYCRYCQFEPVVKFMSEVLVQFREEHINGLPGFFFCPVSTWKHTKGA